MNNSGYLSCNGGAFLYNKRFNEVLTMKVQTMGILGKKLGMTQIFNDQGNAVPVTVLQAGPCAVTQKKTGDKDCYSAIQLGFDELKEKAVTKPLKGHFSKAGTSCYAFLREIRLPAAEIDQFEVGQVLGPDIFQPGDYVDVTGVSKGKGFAGVMKRHNFAGFPASHGTHEVFRHGGAIGQASSPGRVFKGTKMPGRLGGKRSTTQNIEVVKVENEKNLLLVRGAVPGSNGSYLIIKKALKKPSRAVAGKGGE